MSGYNMRIEDTVKIVALKHRISELERELAMLKHDTDLYPSDQKIFISPSEAKSIGLIAQHH